MTLEDRIRKYAEEARVFMLSQVNQRLPGGIAEWVGYDENGKGLVKRDGRIRQVNIIGNICLKKGQIVLLDANDTIQIMDKPPREQPRRKERPRFISVQPPFKKSRPIILSTLFPEELEEEELADEFEFPVDVGFYVLTYTTYLLGSDADGQENPTWPSGGIDYTDIFTPVISETVLPATGAPAVYRIEVGAVAAFAAVPGESSSVSINGGNLSLSATSSNGSAGKAVGVEIERSNSLVSYDITARFDEFANGTYRVAAAYVSFPKAIYYFQGPNDSQDQIQIRKIDLNEIAPQQVYGHIMIHNYITREGVSGSEETYAYSIFGVECVDMNDFVTVTDSTTSTTRELIKDYGKITFHWIHTRLNLNTGELETNITDITDSWSGNEYLIRAEAEVQGGTFLFTQISVGSETEIYDTVGSLSFNYEPVWSQCYSGDWLYAYRNILWDDAAKVNITRTELRNFLKLSYKNEKFYYGWDSFMPFDWTVSDPAYFYEWTPTGNWIGGGPDQGDYHDIENLQAIVLNSSNQVLYDDYFDGSVEGAPSDIDEWVLWGLYYRSPDYPLSGEVIFSEVPQVTVVQTPAWFSYVPPLP